MTDHWEIYDVYKALFALAAGVVLGMERELKDKAAGLKTITVICLGSALFAVISQKVGGADGETTRIASYIVSGVGFLGAGVIFKDQVSVSGLTTAGIIWLAAAVGTAIGFGEFFLALTFMVASLLIVYASPVINRVFKSKKQTRTLIFTLNKEDIHLKEEIVSSIEKQGIPVEQRKLESKEGKLVVTIEAVVRVQKMKWLEQYMVGNPSIISFSI
ncbi:MgtC/SapB family protein [Terrimonas sp. NA20]|uniref:MgtC/SapB family protein n=1 Tax=Terrimonas ginsenosidimutans TaxID=2908004 RepID=A0ABS9KMT8_9BACT|nr:MgtC/SapB family protein [Terrimonas ginsenosidimutans]MCG2613641.1 MgtC/SapB family protein [Terrimonas ginsenosidimutans]